MKKRLFCGGKKELRKLGKRIRRRQLSQGGKQVVGVGGVPKAAERHRQRRPGTGRRKEKGVPRRGDG